MADLASMGGVQPSEFEDMSFVDAVRLASRLRKIKEADQKFQIEMLKVLVESNGSRIVG